MYRYLLARGVFVDIHAYVILSLEYVQLFSDIQNKEGSMLAGQLP